MRYGYGRFWQRQIHEEEGELAYRAVYSAYRLAVSGDEQTGSSARSRRRSDGVFGIHAGRESITLVNDSEREVSRSSSLAVIAATTFRPWTSGSGSKTMLG